jgi:hypothetical protein
VHCIWQEAEKKAIPTLEERGVERAMKVAMLRARKQAFAFAIPYTAAKGSAPHVRLGVLVLMRRGFGVLVDLRAHIFVLVVRELVSGC